MSAQRRDADVITDAETKAAKTLQLRRELRQQGIRDVHTSRKSRAAQQRAVTTRMAGQGRRG